MQLGKFILFFNIVSNIYYGSSHSSPKGVYPPKNLKYIILICIYLLPMFLYLYIYHYKAYEKLNFD